MFNKRPKTDHDEANIDFQDNIEAEIDAKVNVPNQSRRVETAMIGPSIYFKGDLIGDENLIVQGKVEGTIRLRGHDLLIGRKGQLHANVEATTITVEGKLKGDLIGKEKVVIKKTGNVLGNIVAPRVTLEDGAMFKGSIEMEPKVSNQVPRDNEVKDKVAPVKEVQKPAATTSDVVDLKGVKA